MGKERNKTKSFKSLKTTVGIFQILALLSLGAIGLPFLTSPTPTLLIIYGVGGVIGFFVWWSLASIVEILLDIHKRLTETSMPPPSVEKSRSIST